MGYKETANVYESVLLGSEAVSLDWWFPTLRTNVLSSSARVKQSLFFFGCCASEDAGTKRHTPEDLNLRQYRSEKLSTSQPLFMHRIIHDAVWRRYSAYKCQNT